MSSPTWREERAERLSARTAAAKEGFEAWPYLAVEFMLLLADQRHRDRFPFVLHGTRDRERLFQLGLVNSHGWPRQPQAEEAEPYARAIADRWAQGHGAPTMAAYLARLVGDPEPEAPRADGEGG